ncbi:MAG: hypothetical protein ACOYB7_02540 [Mycobacterium sp.]
MTKEPTARVLLENYDLGGITFDQLLEAWAALPMTRPYSMRQGRTWADVYREAEEGDDTDVPAAVSSAKYAGAITAEQAEQLLRIYRRKVR